MGHIPGADDFSDPRSWQELERVLADLKGIAAGTRPTSTDLANAPTLSFWRLATAPTPCLVGFVDDHPRLGGGKLIATSTLWSINYEKRWARTHSRWYALGQGMGE